MTVTYEVVKVKVNAVMRLASPLQELMCHMGFHSVTDHPAEVTFQLLDSATPEGCKAEFT